MESGNTCILRGGQIYHEQCGGTIGSFSLHVSRRTLDGRRYYTEQIVMGRCQKCNKEQLYTLK